MTFDEMLEIHLNLTNSLRIIEESLTKMDWRHLVNRGEKILAIKSYRRTHDVSIKEAKDMIDSFYKLINFKV